MGGLLRAADRAPLMHPDRLGKSKWVKVLPWYYTAKRRRSRTDERRTAIRSELKADE